LVLWKDVHKSSGFKLGNWVCYLKIDWYLLFVYYVSIFGSPIMRFGFQIVRVALLSSDEEAL
jgi:hypothetical protein